MNESGDDKWIRQTREVFHRGVDELPPSVRGRLRAARREALQGRARARTPAPWSRWVSAGAGVAAAALVAVAVVFDGDRGERPVQASDKARDLEILLSGNELELYENLEFYAWVSERERNAG